MQTTRRQSVNTQHQKLKRTLSIHTLLLFRQNQVLLAWDWIRGPRFLLTLFNFIPYLSYSWHKMSSVDWARPVHLAHSEQGLAQQLLRHTYLQHCFFILRPPNLGLSRQLVQTPQSSGTWQPEHCPQRLERRPFFTGGSCWALFLVTGLMGLMGGATGSASSEPAIDDLSTKRTFLM